MNRAQRNRALRSRQSSKLENPREAQAPEGFLCSLGRLGADPGTEARIFLILPILPILLILLEQLQFA